MSTLQHDPKLIQRNSSLVFSEHYNIEMKNWNEFPFPGNDGNQLGNSQKEMYIKNFCEMLREFLKSIEYF